MGVFAYRGRRGGEAVLGRLEAPSLEAVAERLLDLGITPIEVTPAARSEALLATLRERMRRRGVGLDELVVFARQMHSMVRGGLPMLRAIRAIAEGSSSPLLAAALQDVAQHLEAGLGLGSSLGRHPRVFPALFVSTIHMGEETGRLEEAFSQLASYLELERDTRRRVRAATRYPIAVVAAVVIAVGILNVFALPVFADIFADFGASLPWPTRLLITSSQLTRQFWPHLLLACAGMALGLRAWLRSERGRLVWDRRKLRLPLVGSILERATVARFARTLGLSVRSGVPLLHALRVAGAVLGNVWLEARIAEMRDGVERGETLTRSAVGARVFPPLVLQMLAVGEETGALDDLLEEAARFYEAEVDYELKRLSESIEPILIAVIGGLVLLLALGVYLPMWDLAKAARGA